MLLNILRSFEEDILLGNSYTEYTLNRGITATISYGGIIKGKGRGLGEGTRTGSRWSCTGLRACPAASCELSSRNCVFLPYPLEPGSVQEITGLDYSDPDDDDPQVAVMKSCYKANIPVR